MTKHLDRGADVAVLGAGAIGLCVALELATRGHRVSVIDRDALDDACLAASMSPRRASTWAAGGILPPANLATSTDPIDQLRGLSHALFPELANRLQDRTSIDCQLERCGGLYLSNSPGETASMVGMVSYWNELGIECQTLSADDLLSREPGLDQWLNLHPSARAWFVPDEYQIHPPSLIRALVSACRQLGVALLGETTVCEIHDVDSGVKVTCEDGGTCYPKHVIACGGAWLGKMSTSLQLHQSIVPVRGQMLLLRSPRRMFASVLNLGHRYLIPRRDGTVLLGSCEEEVGAQHGTTPRQLAELRRFASDLLPDLISAEEIGAWSGLRPMTFDGFPMCGKLPGSERVFIAGGHFRSGLHLAPGTAVCLADLIEGKQPPLDLEPFRVGKQQTPPISNIDGSRHARG
ncbi:MAG: FAD-dependent oxidoreductase [Planctomycetota bacterium]